MVNAYSQGKGCRLDDTPHHLPTRRNYTIMVGEDVHEDLIALDQRRTNRLTVPSQCGDVINSIVIVIIFNITNKLYNLSELLPSSCPLHDLARLNVYRTKVSCERYTSSPMDYNSDTWTIIQSTPPMVADNSLVLRRGVKNPLTLPARIHTLF